MKELLKIHKRFGVSLNEDESAQEPVAQTSATHEDSNIPVDSEDTTPLASDTDDSASDLNDTVVENPDAAK